MDYPNSFYEAFTDVGNWWPGGYTYLGPIRIPPSPPTVGMVDRAGTGQIWYLMWDGGSHLLLTDELPQYAAGNFYVFQPYDGPWIGTTGWKLGVTTALQRLQLTPAGTPHLIVDLPVPGQGGISSGHPLVAPSLLSPGQQSWPESTGWPSPQPPTVPGIPSSSPVPTGGGYAAAVAAFATNTPPLVSSTFYVATPTHAVLQPEHLIHYGPGA